MASPRQLARQNKCKTYTTGQTCAHGHRAKRFVSNGKCVICSSNDFKAFYKRNRAALTSRAISNYLKRKAQLTPAQFEEFRKKQRARWRRHRTIRIQTLYSLSLAQYRDLKTRQRGRCAVCRNKRRLVIDHCHQTGKVRGLLCHMCNRHLGIYEKYGAGFEAYLTGRFSNG